MSSTLITVCVAIVLLIIVLLARASSVEKREREDKVLLKYRALDQHRSHMELLNRLSGAATSELEVYVKTAESELDIAENEFVEGAIAPFWDAIERAASQLAGC